MLVLGFWSRARPSEIDIPFENQLLAHSLLDSGGGGIEFWKFGTWKVGTWYPVILHPELAIMSWVLSNLQSHN